MQLNVQFSNEQTLIVKAVPKAHVKKLEDALVSNTKAKAVHSVVDKDLLHKDSFLIYANFTSGGEAKRGQQQFERWLDDKWSHARPMVSIKGEKKMKAPETFYPAEQTLVLKNVMPALKDLLQGAVISETQPKNVHSVLDKDDCGLGALLMYANYASVEDTQRAQQRIENWLDSKWEFDCRPLVKIKFRPEANYYGIHVRGLPLDAAVQDVERFFLQFGALHPSPKVHILPSKDGEAYVNFVQLAAAERVLNASCHRSLWFEGAVLVANAGRNMDQPQPSTVPAGKGAYKTRLCRYHEEGRCFDGAACTFAHGEHELSTGFSSRASSCSRSSVSHSVSSSPSTSHPSPQSDVDFTGSSVTPRFLDPQRGLGGMHVGDQGHMARLAAESLGEGGESKLSAFPLSHHLEPHSHDSEPPSCSGMLNGNAPISPSMLNPNVVLSTDGIAIRQQQQMNPMPEDCNNRYNDLASGGPGAETAMERMLQMLMGDQGRGNDFELVSGWIDEIIGGHEGAQVAASLREEMVDVEALAEFSEHDLLKYGVCREGFRKKLVRRAKEERRKRRTESSGSMPECSVCLEGGCANIALVPCGHLCVCEGCLRAHVSLRNCPICQGTIQTGLKVYLS